jgi:hypothetical protein
MAEGERVPTALGQPVTAGEKVAGVDIKIGTPPVVLQTQAYAYIPLERPEELSQWEEDLRRFYGVSADASALRGRACETCSCGCSDDCGFLE